MEGVLRGLNPLLQRYSERMMVAGAARAAHRQRQSRACAESEADVAGVTTTLEDLVATCHDMPAFVAYFAGGAQDASSLAPPVAVSSLAPPAAVG